MRTLLATALLACAMPAMAGGFLHTQGQDIVDESGQKIVLRGLGLGNWLLPEGYMWKFSNGGDRPRKIEKIVSDLIGPEESARFWTEYRRNYITEADIKRLKDLGYNSVRPALNSRLFVSEGENATEVKEGFELLDNLVGWCKKYGVYVIIDMHGAPGGQTGQNIDDSANDQPELFSDPKNQDKFINLWVKIATIYKDEPTVAAYDLLNEPLPQRTGAADKYKDQLEPLYKRVTQAIRAVDKHHMITVEGYDWANNWSVFTEPFDSNLVYQFHYYCWDRPTHLKDITSYLKHRDRLKAPVWVGETGEKDDAIYWGTTSYFEHNNIGWSFWPWKKMDTRNTPYSIKVPEGWNEIMRFSRNPASRPTVDAARKTFAELLQNIRLENCVYYPDVVNSMFRRLPCRIEAENYGHDGLNNSYCVEHPNTKSKFYRTSEPVTVETTQNGQAIKLETAEWTAYEVNSSEPKTYTGTIRVKADQSSLITIQINDQRQEIKVDQGDWTDLKLQPAAFTPGINRIKLSVNQGPVLCDWITFE